MGWGALLQARLGPRLRHDHPGVGSPLSAPATLPGRSGVSTDLLLVAVVGAFACFWRLGTATIGVDEPTYIDAGWDYAHGNWSPNQGHPLLAKELLGIAQRLIGRSIVDVRSVGAAMGVLSGLVIYDVARRLAGRLAGLGAAMMWFLLPQAPGTVVVRLDRYAGLEPPMVLFGLLGLWCAIRVSDRFSLRWVGLAGACFGLSAASKVSGLAYGVALALVVMAAPRPAVQRARAAAVAMLAAAASYLLTVVPSGLKDTFVVVTVQLRHADEGHAQLIAGRVRVHHPWWSNWWWQQTYLTWAGTLALWGLAVVGLGALTGARRLAVAGALGGPLAFFLWSPIKLPHYHLALTPILVIAAAVGIGWVAEHITTTTGPPRAVLAAGALAALVALIVPLASNVRDLATLQPRDYGRIPQVLDELGVPPGPVAVWGWSHVLAPGMPADRPTGGIDSQTPRVVIVDPVVADREPTGSTADRVSELTAGLEPVHVDRLLVYVLP